MQRLNPFARKTIPYHRVSKDFNDQPSNSDSVQKEGHNEEEAYLLAQDLHRARRSRWGHFCGYFFVALISLLLGLTFSQIFRGE
jgi:hypothetical protein